MRIGIDLGGTKIEAIALGPGGRELARKRVPTPQADYAATLQQVVALVFEMEKSLGEKATVGIGMGALARDRDGEEL
jgi:fructokinase